MWYRSRFFGVGPRIALVLLVSIGPEVVGVWTIGVASKEKFAERRSECMSHDSTKPLIISILLSNHDDLITRKSCCNVSIPGTIIISYPWNPREIKGK